MTSLSGKIEASNRSEMCDYRRQMFLVRPLRVLILAGTFVES